MESASKGTMNLLKLLLIQLIVLTINVHSINNNKLSSSRKLLITYNAWTTASSSLPRKDSQMATGYHNNSIFLIGGWQYRYQLIEYDTLQNRFIDHGALYLYNATYGYGQYYSQINDILYIIDPNGDKFSTFNLKTKVFKNYWNNISIPTDGNGYACLASYEHYLFIMYDTDFQIFNISSNQWVPATPSMNTVRTQSSCILHPKSKYLYIMGGINAIYLKTVERIDVANMNNISNELWSNTESLLYAAERTRAVIFETDILVIGGYSRNPDIYTLPIQVIDSITGQVSSGGELSYGIRATSAIIVNSIAYAFGGLGGDTEFVNLHTWQYVNLPPTNEPTNTPSSSTLHPTSVPTNAPSISPSLSPSQTPSLPPSNVPSLAPSTVPSEFPTYSPSVHPSQHPTANPSYYPRNPSIAPTINPTTNPTFSPIQTAFSLNEIIGNQIFIMVIASAIVCCCVLMIISFIIGTKRKLNKSKDTDDTIKESEVLEIHHNSNEDNAKTQEKLTEIKSAKNKQNDRKNEENDSDDMYQPIGPKIIVQMTPNTEGSFTESSTEKITLNTNNNGNDGENYEEYVSLDEYDWIENTLKQKECAGNDWEKYLYDFKKNRINESNLSKLTDKEWRELIPEIGIRVGFRELWEKRYKEKCAK